MGDHRFQMRLSCRYEQPDNKVTELNADNLEEGERRALELHPQTPGFLIFVYAIFNCQHLYLRTNAAERGLLLDSARGSIEVIADEDWAIQTLRLHFTARLKAGRASPQDVSYIVGRMEQCPVSRNLRAVADAATSVEFAPH